MLIKKLLTYEILKLILIINLQTNESTKEKEIKLYNVILKNNLFRKFTLVAINQIEGGSKLIYALDLSSKKFF